MDIIFKIAAIGLLTAIVNQLLKKADKDEIATLMIVDMIGQLFDALRTLFSLY